MRDTPNLPIFTDTDVISRRVHPAFSGSFEQSADSFQQLLRVQDFVPTRAGNHSGIRTYLGVRPVQLVQSQLTGAT